MLGLRLNRAQQGTLLKSFSKQLIEKFGSSIISYFPIDDLSGTVMTDVVNGYNGVYGSITLNSDSFKTKPTGLWGASSWCNMFNSVQHLSVDEGTVIMFVKMPEAQWTDGNRYNFFRFSGTSDNPSILFFKRNSASNNTVAVYFTRNGVVKSVEQSAISKDGWIMFSVSWSKTLNKSEARINGNLFNIAGGKTTCAGDVLTSWTANYASLGSYYGVNATGGSSLHGNISNVLILNRYATESELLSILNYKEVIFEGDSRTAEGGFPTMSYGTLDFTSRNVALGGTTLTQMIARATTSVDPFYSSKSKLVSIWGGVNDPSASAQALYDQLKEYCLARRSVGFKTIVCTEIDAQDVARNTAGWHTKYLDLNILLREDHSFADAIADLGLNANLQDANNTTYFLADKVHLTMLGQMQVASVVEPVIASLL